MKKIFLLFALLLSIGAKAAVFNIANGDVAGLIAAINTANANSEADIINLATNGTYTLTAINFTSTSPNTTGNASQRGLPRILDNVTGLDLTINANGSTIIRDNAAPNFGIFAIAGQTVINDLTVRNGRVNAQGAGIFVEFKGNTELNNCKFYDNTSTLDAEGGGGAIYTKSLSILRVTNCYFENNKAVNQGGAISNLLSNLYVINSTFKNNSTTDLVGADPCGGAIYDDGARGDNGELVIRGCTFEGNSSNGQGQGGAMFLFPYNSQSVEVTGCTFKTNSAKQGGAFWHKGGGSSGIPDPEYPLSAAAENTTLLFNTCVFDGNTSIAGSGGMGGALWISDCKVNEIHSCTFKYNTADLGGAVALLTNKAFTFRNSTFNNNTANQSGAIFAGGITGKLTVQNCTFAANIANQYGGAMSVPQNATPVDIINCTFANNQANNAGNGQSGAIHSANNSGNSTVMIKNNIFYNQTVTNPWNVWKNCNSELNDGGNNIFFPENAGGRCVATPTNSLFTDPLLSPLADNGGLTQTMALQAGSPAINFASTGAPATDQIGAARVGVADAGAKEYTAPTGSVYYVDAVNGNDTFTGLSVATAKKTIQAAANLTVAGDIVYVMNGTYTNSCADCPVVNVNTGGTASAYVTYTNYAGHTPKLKFNGWGGFSINNGSSYLKISGFEIEGNNANVTLAAALNQPKSCANPTGTYDPLYNGNGIQADGRSGQHPHHLVITKNIIHDCGGAGISAIQSDYVTVEDNVLYNNCWYTLFGTSAISLYQLWNFDAAGGYHNVVRRNKCYKNRLFVPWRAFCQITDGNGIIIDDSKNTQNGSTLGAYNGRTLVENNICWYNGGSGIHAYESEHVDIINNTAYFNSQSTEIDGGEIFANTSNDIKIYNNILYADNQKINTNWNNTSLQYFNNLHFNGTTTGITDASCVNANPMFTNAANLLTADFTIQVGSPAIDAGSATFCSSTDFLGAVRTGICDIGAYQMASPTTFPEIQVLEATTDIPDNTGTYAFGTTPVGTPIVKTFTIKNIGAANLTVSALTLPSGFALVGTFPSSIAAGTEATFQVRLTAALQGIFSGALSFTNNDADENPFNFTISGTVALATTALPAAIATGTPKFSCGMTEAAIIAAGATKLTFGGSNYYIGTRQTTSINQDPVIAKFTAGVQDWCNQAYETTGADGRGNGLFWSGTDLYAVFSTDGTQGTVAQDYRRFTTSGWLKTFSDASPGGGGGPKVAILAKIDPATGDGIVGNGTFITALNSSTNKTNSLAIKDVYLDGSGNVVVRADSWFAPRKVNKTAMVQTGTGGSPHDYTLVFNSSLTTALCASAVGWDNGTGTDCSGAIIPAPTVSEIQVLEGLNDVADNTGSINFGTTVVGTPVIKTFTIKNLGTATLTLTAPTLPTGFSLVGVFPTSIAAGADATFQLSLTATAASSPSGQISFANNDSNENPFNFALSGTVTATATPEIQVLEGATDIPDNTGNVNFGTTLTSTPITKTFTIKNIGTSILTLGALSPLPTGFSLVGAFPASVAVGASATFQIKLEDATENVFTGSLSFVNDDADENPFNFTISGTVTNTPTPDIQILDGANDITNTASTLNFGTTVVNTDIIKTFTIKNTGTGTLTLGTLNLPAGFGLIGTFPTSVAAGTSETFQIYLDADAINSASGTLSFTNNSTTKSSFSLTLAGTVTPIVVIPPTPPVPPTPAPPPSPTVTPPVYVAPPISLTVGQVTENQINFTWNTLPNVTQYAIERRLVGQTNFERINTTTTNSFADDSVLPAEYYEYSIVALSATPQMSAIFAISTLPTAPTATEAFVCGTGSTTLIAQATTTKTVTYKWYEKENDTNGLPSNTLQNTEANTFVTPQIQQNTTFYVSTVFNGKESKKTAVNVSIKPLPIAKIREGNGMPSNTISFCEKGVLNAEKVEGASYRWLLNEQEISKGESVEIRFTGTYQLAVSQDGCEKISEPMSVIINSLPIAQILQGEKVKFCRKGTIQAQVFSSITYEWTDEKGKVIGNEPTLNLTQSGVYTLKTKQNGCESKPAQIKVEIPLLISAPNITANKTTICEGETLKLEVPQIQEVTYYWYNNFGFTSRLRNFEIPYSKDLLSSTYFVYVVKDGCNSDTASIDIKISQPISFEIKMQNPNCIGSKDGKIEILADNPNLVFSVNNMLINSKLIDNLGKGEYTITAKNEFGCEQTQKVSLNEPADFKVIASEDVKISRFISAQLSATGAVRYEWSPSIGLDNPNSPNPKANPLETMTYMVKGYNENGCVRTDQVVVTVLETENIVANKVLSPNNDSMNDFWEIADIDKFPENRLVVYNRFGQRVYEAQNYRNNWDGRALDDGTYYFILYLPENKQLNGIITVAR